MSGFWDVYSDRVTVRGENIRTDRLTREKLRLRHMLKDSLSYHEVDIYDDGITAEQEGLKQSVAIINSDNLDEKYVYSLPDEDLQIGDLFYWSDNYWLFTERDANNELYVRMKAKQCNYLLKWIDIVNDEPTILEQWCFVEDGTKYMTGELEDRNFIVTRGDARIAIMISRNQFTKRFNRKSRFLIDDSGSDNLLSFDLSKPLKVGHTYNDKGIYQFVLSESNSSQYDNMELGIADYYQFFPREDGDDVPDDTDAPATENTERRIWI